MDDNIALNDLSRLQHELENFLLFLVKKCKTLSTKISNPYHPMDNKVERSKPSNVVESKLGVSDERPSKKSKISIEKMHKATASSRTKSKKMQQSAKSQEHGFPEKSDVPKAQKNDSSNRFWSFVDSYCSDITMDDTKVFENWIESHVKDSDYQSIPKLGRHYTSEWIERDIADELREDSKSMENPIGRDYSCEANSRLNNMLKYVQTKVDNLGSEHPSLVEKLISSLVHENIITSPSDMMTESVSDNSLSARRDNESSHFPHAVEDSIQSRLLAELELDVLENTPKDKADDELLRELKRLQALLIPISQYNLLKKQKLLIRAKAEMARQEAQKRIQEADAKVMENYRAMYAARSKGKKMTKKELSQIKELLEERKAVIKNSRIMY